MNDNNQQFIALEVKGVSLSPGNDEDGIAVGHMGGNVFITITRGGMAHYVRLQGDDIDIVAGLMADAMSAATRAAPPTEVTCQ